ncbi:hypothetical protein PG984_010903 [Apiospora sp. TS-2023a]
MQLFSIIYLSGLMARPNQDSLHTHYHHRNRNRDCLRDRDQHLHHDDMPKASANGLSQVDVNGDGVPVVLRARLHRDGADHQELRVPGRHAHDDGQLPLQQPRLVRADRLQDALPNRHRGVLKES